MRVSLVGGFKLISSHEFHSFATCYLQKVVSPEEETLAICVELEEERQELFVLQRSSGDPKGIPSSQGKKFV
jgi:hypothetical protein